MQLVDISDSNLRTAIAREFEKSSVNDLAAVPELNLQENGIDKLDGLEGAKSLVTLRGGGNSISDLLPLKGLTKLKTLDFWGNTIENLSPLEGLKT